MFQYLIRFMNNMGKGVHLDQLLAYSVSEQTILGSDARLQVLT